MRIRLMLGLSFLIILLTGLSCAPVRGDSSNFNNRFNSLVRPFTFNVESWEYQTLSAELRQNIHNPVPEAQLSSENVMLYFSLMAQIDTLSSNLQSVSGNNSSAKVIQERNDLNDVEARAALLQDTVEHTLAVQISQVLASQGIFNPFGDKIRVVFPPVNFKLEQPLYVFIVSHRDKIDRLEDVTLRQDTTLAQAEELESSVDKLNVSSLAIEIGGLGFTYPTFVIRNSDLHWTLNTAAHEWVHQYLAFRPLGFRYVLDLTGISPSPAIATLNETVADIVGTEVGSEVYQKFYAGYDIAGNQGSTVSPAVPAFDFNQTMRETRIRVDNLLAGGQVDQAEQYMENQRQVFVKNGYYLRKLNQAYFSFYGSYSDSPTSVDPTGNQLKALRDQSLSLKDYLDTVSGFETPEDLKSALSRITH